MMINKKIAEALKTVKEWMETPYLNDVYEALRCPDPMEINRVYDRQR